MDNHTFQMVEAALKLDQTVSPARRKKFLQSLSGEPSPVPAPDDNGHSPRVYSRAKAAMLLGDKTPRYIDLLCRRGLLQKFVPKGNRRAIGILSESLHEFINGN